MLFKFFILSCCLMGLASSLQQTVLVASNLAELQALGWSINGTIPFILEKPGSWKAALKPLDNDVTGNETWRVTSTTRPTLFTTDVTHDCDVYSAQLRIKYYYEQVNLVTFPCKTGNPAVVFCYGEAPNTIQWSEISNAVDVRQLNNGKEIEIQVHIEPDVGGYILFDQVSLELDMDCATMAPTEEPSTTEQVTDGPTTNDPTTEPATTEPVTDPVTETDLPGSTTAEPEPSTTSPPECSTTPQPPPCDCCDRCSAAKAQEVHHHYHYYYPTDQQHIAQEA